MEFRFGIKTKRLSKANAKIGYDSSASTGYKDAATLKYGIK